MKKELFWVLIPARSKSKSIKNKNIIKINDKPILAYSILAAKKLRFVKKIIVSSDSIKYLRIAKKYGANLLHLRSEKLSGDKITDLEVFKGFLKDAKKKELKLPEFFIHLRPTTPFRDIKVLKKGIDLFLKNKRKYSAMRSVGLMSFPSQKTMRIKNKKLCSVIKIDFDMDKLNKPRNFYDKSFMPNGYIDIIKTENILNNKIHGNKVLPFVIDKEIPDIDSKKDLHFAEFLMKKKNY